ncbi:hypothetical protein EDB86DRAFT_2829871 [Lactarius hatsudake]|nr:hypothetical protein EDB86DRAFT_2829871 [Lactarius hatsudake]
MPTQPHVPRPSLLAYARGRTTRPAQPVHARGRPPQSLQHGRRQPSSALHAPPLPARVRKGTDRAPSPAHTHKGTDSAHPTPLGDAALAPRAPPLPAHERKGADGASTRATPAQPYATRARNGRDGTPTSVPSARAMPVQPHAHHTASPVHERGGTTRLPPPHGLRQPQVDAPRHACTRLGMQEGRLRAAPRRRGARKGGTQNEGRCNPSVSGTSLCMRTRGAGKAGRNPGGGVAREWKGRHIGTGVRKGEGDGDGVPSRVYRRGRVS